MGEILFSREKVPYNVSKNKLVRKKRRDIGLPWELLTPGYGLLTEYIYPVYCEHSLVLLGNVFFPESLSIFLPLCGNRPFYHYGGHIEFITFKEYYGMPRGHSLSIYARF